MDRSLSSASVDIMLSSLSNNTYKQYESCIKSWIDYCQNNNYSYTNASVPVVIHFLTEIFNKGAKYGTINSTKSAIALIVGNKINDDRMNRFMKGVFKMRPPMPKYNLVWDPNVVLNYLSQYWPNDDLNLDILTKKTITLLALVSAHRVQTYSLIKIVNIQINEGKEIIIKIPDHIKTSGPNKYQPLLRIPFFIPKPEICPGLCLKSYINKTRPLRNNCQEKLFVSLRRPHRNVSSQTLSHWIKDVLTESGVDTDMFSAHSTRHASTSTARSLGVNIDIIRRTAGWSDSSGVFARFYNKEIICDTSVFASAILNNNDTNV